jgi:hypothetical protein
MSAPACVRAAALPLAALHGLSPDDVQGRLSTFLKHQLSVGLVLDLGLGSALALTEAAAEFVARWVRVGWALSDSVASLLLRRDSARVCCCALALTEAAAEFVARRVGALQLQRRQ